MPALALLLGNAFAGFIAFLATYFTKKAAVVIALSTFLVGGWIILQTALFAMWTALAFTLPSELVDPLRVAAYLMPTNTTGCVAALVSARLARWLWDRQREWAQVVAAA